MMKNYNISCYNCYKHQKIFILTRGGGGGDSSTFATGLLLCLLGVWNLGCTRLFGGLQIRGPSYDSLAFLGSEIYCRRSYLGSNISVCPQKLISRQSENFGCAGGLKRTSHYLGLWKSWCDYLGVWENCLTWAPRSKSRGVPTGF